MIDISKLHFLGYSVCILSNEIIVRSPHYSNLNKFMINNISYNHTSIGTFVLIESDNYYFIGTIIKEDLSEHDTKVLINENEPNKTETPEIYIKVLSEINPINMELVRFSNHVPVFDSKVYLANKGIISKFIKSISRSKSKSLNKDDFRNNGNCLNRMCTKDFASLSQDKDICVNIPFNTLFSKHLGIVGSTGSGKSYTAAKLILNLAKRKQHIILLDPTGEYEAIVNSLKINNQDLVSKFTIGKDTKIPYFDLNDNELYKLIRPSSGIQFPKLKDSIKDLKVIHLYNLGKLNSKYLTTVNQFISDDGGVIKFKEHYASEIYDLKRDINSVNLSNVGYKFSELPRQLKEESYGINKSGEAYLADRNWGYCASLADRINSNENVFSSYFCNSFKNISNSYNLQKRLTYNSLISKRLVYINLENVTFNDHVAEVIGDYIARKLLITFVNNSDHRIPVVLFLDEAHNFIKRDNPDDGFHLHYFNLIAKEGRKYGLFMTLITQSPYDLSRDVLTQFGTFIIHHLGNGKEREQITSALPYNSNLDKYISSLNTGEAIVSSNDLYSPLMVYIHKPSIPPKSNTPKFN